MSVSVAAVGTRDSSVQRDKTHTLWGWQQAYQGVIMQWPQLTDEETGLKMLINFLKVTQQVAEGIQPQGHLAPDSNLLFIPYILFPPFFVNF